MVKKRVFLPDGNQMGPFFWAPWGLLIVRKKISLVLKKLEILVFKHNLSYYS